MEFMLSAIEAILDNIRDAEDYLVEEDIANYKEKNAISMLAKWIKTPDASSQRTRTLGIKTAIKLGYSVYDFKRILRKLRKHIGIVETYMSLGQWDKIKYSAVPSRAMMIYRDAFLRHDEEGFSDFIQKAVKGEEKINSSTLYPYDIVEKILYKNGYDDTLEAQWRQLPDYVENGTNAIVMADVSGSMTCAKCWRISQYVYDIFCIPFNRRT